MDLPDVPWRTETHRRVAAGLAETVEAAEPGGYDDACEALFAGLVAGVEAYVSALIVRTRARPLDAPASLGDRVVTGQLLEDPEGFEDLDGALFAAYLRLTLTAIGENLDPGP